MGETMEEGRLVDWLVKPGQAFKRGQDILEVETDKTIVEFPALGDGTVVETLVEIGDTVSVGTPIARIDVGDGPDWTDDGSDAGEETAQPEPAATPAEATQAPAAPPGAMPAAGDAAPPAAAPGDGPLRATPVARRIARQRGIDLDTLTGTGRRGRIEREDVEAAGTTSDETRQVAGITFLEKGPATGAPVLLLHGFAADHMAWGGVQSRLSGKGRRTLGVDLPGHGTTLHEARAPEDLHPPLDRALNDLAPGPVHIVAHSMGAIAAVRLARMRAVRSLTLIAPAGLGHAIDAGFIRGLAGATSAGEVSHLLGRVTEGPHGASPAMIEPIHRVTLARAPERPTGARP